MKVDVSSGAEFDINSTQAKDGVCITSFETWLSENATNVYYSMESYSNIPASVPNNRPVANCSSREVSTLASFFLSSYFFCVFLDRFLFSTASSASVWIQQYSG